jgi:hypothetical protein
VPGDSGLPALFFDNEGALVRQPAAAGLPLQPLPTAAGLSSSTILALLGVAVPPVEELYVAQGRALVRGVLPAKEWLLPDKKGRQQQPPAEQQRTSGSYRRLLPGLQGTLLVLRELDRQQLQRARALQRQGLLEAPALGQLLEDWRAAAPLELRCGLLLGAAQEADAAQSEAPSTSAAAAAVAAGDPGQCWERLWGAHRHRRRECQQRVQQHFQGVAARPGTPWQRRAPAQGAAGQGGRPGAGAAAAAGPGARPVDGKVAVGAGAEALQWADAMHSAAALLGLRQDVVDAARARFQRLVAGGHAAEQQQHQ